jgi:hypothetical protein
LHQLIPNAIIQISMFISAITSCGGQPTVDVFTHHYELHYQNKKIHLEGSNTTFAMQFGCISFYPSQFGNQGRLTRGISGRVAEMITGSIAGCLWSKKSMFETKEPTR